MSLSIRLPASPLAAALCASISLGALAAEPDAAPSIEHQMRVQRACQTAIWGMPAAGMIDFEKATKRDLGGDVNDVVYMTRPMNSRHGFLTANDVTPYVWASLSTEAGPLVVEVPAATDKVGFFGTIVNAWDVLLEDVGPLAEQRRARGEHDLGTWWQR